LDYKEIFKIAFLLISSPARAWEEIRIEEDKQKVITSFVYPMIGLCALSVFIGSIWTNGWGGPQSFQFAMSQCAAIAVALFGGYYLAAFAINQLCVTMLGMPDDLPLARQFAGYAMVVTFLLHLVMGLLPEFAVIGWLLHLYIIYLVWVGAPVVMQVSEADRLRFTIPVSVLLVICPAFIHLVFNQLNALLT